jgi:hypothetical protein
MALSSTDRLSKILQSEALDIYFYRRGERGTMTARTDELGFTMDPHKVKSTSKFHRNYNII